MKSLLVSLIVLGTSLSAAQKTTVEPGRVPQQAQQAQQKTRPMAPSQRFALAAAPVTDLGPIDDSIRDKPSPRHGVARVGVTRALTQAQTSAGVWQVTGDGSSVWRLDLKSTDAMGVRIHFTNFSVGSGQVWVHDTNSPAVQVFGPYTGQGHFNNGAFWTDVIFSSTIEVEYKPAAGAATSGAPPFTIAALSHIWRVGPYESPRSDGKSVVPALNHNACFLDATCYQSTPAVADATHSSTYIEFTDTTGSYSCSGTMLNAPNGQPLLLTAGHCINVTDDVQSLVAFFDFRTQECGQNADTYPSDSYYASLPQVDGEVLVAFADQPFLDPTSTSEVKNDLDYSLVLLSSFPTTPDLMLSGYTTVDLPVGGAAVSVSYPLGYFAQVAFGTSAQPEPGYDAFNAAFDIDQTSHGRTDYGSSGSGIFDSGGHLLGLLSTGPADCANPDANGNCPTQDTACDSPPPFISQYTKFSAIYPQIASFLTGVLPSQNALPQDPTVFYANPNPIDVTDGSGLGQTTLFYNAPSASTVQIHLGAPDGPLFAGGNSTGQATTGKWVTDGMVFYLQDVTDGNDLTEENTIDTVTVHLAGNSFTASPRTIVSANGLGQTTLSWGVAGTDIFAIHLGSPNGPLFAEGGPVGTATTGKWVTDGMTFYLVDVTQNTVVSQLTVSVSETTNNGSTQPVFEAAPNPIVVTPGASLGETTLEWNAPGYSVLEIHIGAPNGPLFASGNSSGTATTGEWVTNGTTFYLQNVTGGVPLTSLNTVATTTVRLSQ